MPSGRFLMEDFHYAGGMPGLKVLRGNLAPKGAIIKPSAASPELLRHRGPAVVFNSIEDLHARIDDPALDVDASSVITRESH